MVKMDFFSTKWTYTQMPHKVIAITAKLSPSCTPLRTLAVHMFISQHTLAIYLCIITGLSKQNSGKILTKCRNLYLTW